MLYDSLSLYEQSVCKCASALGVTFLRSMLFNVLSSSTERMIGLAMMKFFELNIFSCAMGDFSNSNISAMKNNVESKKSTIEFISCDCINIVVSKACRFILKIEVFI